MGELPPIDEPEPNPGYGGMQCEHCGNHFTPSSLGVYISGMGYDFSSSLPQVGTCEWAGWVTTNFGSSFYIYIGVNEGYVGTAWYGDGIWRYAYYYDTRLCYNLENFNFVFSMYISTWGIWS